MDHPVFDEKAWFARAKIACARHLRIDEKSIVRVELDPHPVYREWIGFRVVTDEIEVAIRCPNTVEEFVDRLFPLISV